MILMASEFLWSPSGPCPFQTVIFNQPRWRGLLADCCQKSGTAFSAALGIEKVSDISMLELRVIATGILSYLSSLIHLFQHSNCPVSAFSYVN